MGGNHSFEEEVIHLRIIKKAGSGVSGAGFLFCCWSCVDQHYIGRICLVDGPDKRTETVILVERFPERLGIEFKKDGNHALFFFCGGREISPFGIQRNGVGQTFNSVSFRDADSDPVPGNAAPLADKVVLSLSPLKGGTHRIWMGGNKETLFVTGSVFAYVDSKINLHPGTVVRAVIVPEIVPDTIDGE